MISFVYFDLDDTLLGHRAAEKAALIDLCTEFPDFFGDFDHKNVQDVYHAGNVPLWKDYAQGKIDKAGLKYARFANLCTNLEIKGVDPDQLSDYYMQQYACHWQWLDGAAEAFQSIAERYPVGILTNGFSEIQQAKLARFPILTEKAKAIVISEDVGVMKPNPGIFTHATEKAGVLAQNILYVGDSWFSDVKGGSSAGWQVAWLNTKREKYLPENVFRFVHWKTLLDKL